jgi:hypothetical protein
MRPLGRKPPAAPAGLPELPTIERRSEANELTEGQTSFKSAVSAARSMPLTVPASRYCCGSTAHASSA